MNQQLLTTTIVGVTFVDPASHYDDLGQRMIVVGQGDESFGPSWEARLAFNLALASLLGRAADLRGPEILFTRSVVCGGGLWVR